MNYRVIYDGECSAIEATDDPVSEYNDVFGSLTQAKKELLQYLQNRILGLRLCAREIRKIKKETLSDE